MNLFNIFKKNDQKEMSIHIVAEICKYCNESWLFSESGSPLHQEQCKNKLTSQSFSWEDYMEDLFKIDLGRLLTHTKEITYSNYRNQREFSKLDLTVNDLYCLFTQNRILNQFSLLSNAGSLSVFWYYMNYDSFTGKELLIEKEFPKGLFIDIFEDNSLMKEVDENYVLTLRGMQLRDLLLGEPEITEELFSFQEVKDFYLRHNLTFTPRKIKSKEESRKDNEGRTQWHRTTSFLRGLRRLNK